MATLKEALIGTEEQNKQGQANLDKAAQSGSEIAKMLGGKEKPTTPKPEESKPEVKKAKGGKVMKKTKKFDDGGRIGEDVRERAMRSVANLTDEGDVATITRNEYGDITPTLSSMEKSAAQKTRAEPASPSLPKRAAFVKKANKAGFTADQTGGGAALLTRRDRLNTKPMYKSGGKVKSASSRADGCAIRGKTRA